MFQLYLMKKPDLLPSLTCMVLLRSFRDSFFKETLHLVEALYNPRSNLQEQVSLIICDGTEMSRTWKSLNKAWPTIIFPVRMLTI